MDETDEKEDLQASVPENGKKELNPADFRITVQVDPVTGNIGLDYGDKLSTMAVIGALETAKLLVFDRAQEVSRALLKANQSRIVRPDGPPLPFKPIKPN